MSNNERPSRFHVCSDACGFCRATERLAALEASKAETSNEAFDAVLEAEHEVRTMQTIIAFRKAGVPEFVAERQEQSLTAARARLNELMGAMDMDTLRAFGEYRKNARES